MIKGGIGFFDSGVGGLSVLNACLRVCTNYPVYYYGDNVHAPYGNKTKKEIRAYVHRAFDLFSALDVQAAVVACNTVTALLIDELREYYPFPIVGIEPAVMSAAREGGKILVLATPATHASAKFKSLMNRAKVTYPNAALLAVPCEGLALAIEDCARGEDVCIEPYLPPYQADCVVLGCTHYTCKKREISAYYGCKTFDGNEGTAHRLASLLKDRDRRPLCPKNEQAKPFLPTFTFNKSVCCKRTSKIGEFWRKKGVRFSKMKMHQRLYFLGESRLLNCQFYKQMFVFHKNSE